MPQRNNMERMLTIQFHELDSWKLLSSLDQELVVKAYEVSKNAYAPYSAFHVGASLRLQNGQILTGSNQENIAYPSGLCAERVVLFYAGSQYPNSKIETICVVAKGELLPFDKILSPCGSCRQVMLESEIRQTDAMRVILVSQNEKTLVFKNVKDLLPFAFGTV
jgi:cytidine deaminase